LVNEQQMHQMIEHEGEFDFWCIWAVSEKWFLATSVHKNQYRYTLLPDFLNESKRKQNPNLTLGKG
jgi:hypothetical protein